MWNFLILKQITSYLIPSNPLYYTTLPNITQYPIWQIWHFLNKKSPVFKAPKDLGIYSSVKNPARPPWTLRFYYAQLKRNIFRQLTGKISHRPAASAYNEAPYFTINGFGLWPWHTSCLVLIYILQWKLNVGIWRSWDRAWMAFRRPGVRIPLSPPRKDAS